MNKSNLELNEVGGSDITSPLLTLNELSPTFIYPIFRETPTDSDFILP